MAKKKQEVEVDTKEINKFISNFVFEKPEKSEDGTLKTPRYLTGIATIDKLTNGGFPQGRAVGFGAEKGAGKTTAIIQACGNIIERYDKKVYYLDVEGGANYELVESMGFADLLYHPELNKEGKFYLLQPSTIQEIAAIIKKVTKDPDTAIIVIDSDTFVVDGNALEEDDLGASNKAVGSDARMWSKNSKTINAVIKKSKACLVIIHQARVDLSGWQPVIKSTGGNAIKHMASVEIWGKRRKWIAADLTLTSNKKEAIGAYVELSTNKNRLTKPFVAIMVPIIFGRGISNAWAYKEWLENHDIVDEATGEVIPIINKKGGWYNITLPFITQKVQGEKKVWDIINENYDEVVKYVESNGGLELSVAAEENPFN